MESIMKSFAHLPLGASPLTTSSTDLNIYYLCCTSIVNGLHFFSHRSTPASFACISSIPQLDCLNIPPASSPPAPHRRPPRAPPALSRPTPPPPSTNRPPDRQQPCFRLNSVYLSFKFLDFFLFISFLDGSIDSASVPAVGEPLFTSTP